MSKWAKTGPVRGVSDRNSDMLIQISFKLGMIMNLYNGHMHVNWIFDPIQDGRLPAILVVNAGPVRGVSDRNSDMLIQISFKLDMVEDLYRRHMHVNWIFDPIQDGRLAAILDVNMGPGQGCI